MPAGLFRCEEGEKSDDATATQLCLASGGTVDRHSGAWHCLRNSACPFPRENPNSPRISQRPVLQNQTKPRLALR